MEVREGDVERGESEGEEREEEGGGSEWRKGERGEHSKGGVMEDKNRLSYRRGTKSQRG